MRLLHAVPAIFMIVLALGIIAGTNGLRFWDGITPGARFFPGWLAAIGATLAVLMLIAQWRGADAATLEFPNAQGFMAVGATVAGLVALGLLARPLGMVPALSLFVLIQLLLVLRAPFWPSVVTTLVIAVLIEGIFVRWLSVPVPPPFFI